MHRLPHHPYQLAAQGLQVCLVPEPRREGLQGLRSVVLAPVKEPVDKRLERLERGSEQYIITIPQKDGSTVRFPRKVYQDAWENAIARMGAGDLPEEHPMITACLNSSDPKWRKHFLFGDDEDWTEQLEDTSV